MYKCILIFFIYYNIQFLFDYAYKSYQVEFLKSTESNININYFILFNFFHFILMCLHICEKHINMLFLEQPIKENIFYDTFEKIKTMPKYWLECNSQKKLDLIISNAQNSFYGRYHTCFELYGAIIRVCMNSYILYTMNSSIKLLFIYFLFYLAFYNYIILNSRTYVKSNNKTKSKYELLNKNLYLNYFNSCIGKYQSDYINILNNNNIKINKINLDNQVVDKIYLGSLQLFQKVLMCIYMYNYIRNNCENKCSLLLLPLYQTTITLVYQFEYILHNYYGIINQDFTNYNNFIEMYNENKKINYKYTLNLFTINYKLTYPNKKSLIFNTNLILNKNDKIIIKGQSGIGKSTLCKIVSDYFNDYITQKKILYIPQDIYLYFENRTLEDVITENDLMLFNNDKNILNYVINKLVPFDDILNGFTINSLNTNLSGKSFSGGQEKRIYLAKWLYYLILNIDKYDIVIFDEPDKSLDNLTSEKLIHNILNNKILSKLCIIIVSHNNYNHNLFSKIIELKNINNNIHLIAKNSTPTSFFYP